MNYGVGTGQDYAAGSKLQSAYVEFMRQQQHNVAVNLAFNSGIGVDAAKDVLRKFMARSNRTIIGQRWDRREDRIRGFFFVENPHTNLHYHGSVRIQQCDLWHASRTMRGIWSELVNKGSSDIAPIQNETAYFIYSTKDLRSAEAQENWINTEDFWLK